jgi:hypothetical protein
LIKVGLLILQSGLSLDFVKLETKLFSNNIFDSLVCEARLFFFFGLLDLLTTFGVAPLRDLRGDGEVLGFWRV